MYLPDFNPGDIPILLQYSNDFKEIPYFPVNPISSLIPPKFRLGECLLWTIESIKRNYDNEEKLSKYPSFIPMLGKKEFENDPGSQILNEVELNEVYTLYLDWWQENEHLDFELFRFDNVFEDTLYFWR